MEPYRVACGKPRLYPPDHQTLVFKPSVQCSPRTNGPTEAMLTSGPLRLASLTGRLKVRRVFNSPTHMGMSILRADPASCHFRLPLSLPWSPPVAIEDAAVSSDQPAPLQLQTARVPGRRSLRSECPPPAGWSAPKTRPLKERPGKYKSSRLKHYA